MSESEEKSNAKFYVIGIAAVLFAGFATWAYRTYQRPVRITPKEGDILAEKFGNSQLDSVTVAPLPGARTKDAEGKTVAAIGPRLPENPVPESRQPESAKVWLTGRVTLKGTPPAERPLDLDPECRADVKRMNLPAPMTRDFVLGTNGGLANVLVSVLNHPGNMQGESLDPVTINIRGCQIHPAHTAVLAGQLITFKNHDTDFYELQGAPKNLPNPQIDFALLPGAPGPGMAFVNPEDLIVIHTDKRPWIKAHISVTTHLYFGVTDSNGWFRLPLPPLKNARLRALHPLLPPAVETVALDSKTNAPVHLILEYEATEKATQ